MMPMARVHFEDELRALEDQTLGGLDMVVDACERTLEAVLHQDIELASYVVNDDDRIDGRYLEVHQGILSLMARQAPVATDLRLIAALLDVIRSVERMGDQCVNICKLVPLAGREPPVEQEILGRVERMARQAISQVSQCKQAFAQRDVPLAEDLVRQDDEIDRLNREIFRLALELGEDADAREWGMHMMLVARQLERIGDNAVDIGEQTAFVVTGLFREFTDASHPELEARHLASGSAGHTL
jgi:phosphate transport system protein